MCGMPFRPLRALVVLLGAACLALATAATAAAQDGPRVVALTPFTANIVHALGVEPVAVGDPGTGGAALAPAVKALPRLRLSHPNGPNIEQLAAMRPDVVLSSPVWRPGTPAIQRLGIEVYDDIEPQRLAEVGASVRELGKLVGRDREAASLARKLQRQVAAAERGTKRRPRVLVVLGLARYTMALLEESWASDILRAAGARLVTDGMKPVTRVGEGAFVASLSNEKVIELNPDVIVVVPHGNAGDIPQIKEYYRNYRPWRTTKAGRNGRIHVAPNDRLLQAYSDPAAQIRFARKTYLSR
jgi:iron complex transport system substrate-binding protein